MERLAIPLLAAFLLASATGCGRSSEPKPLSGDERREFMEQLEEVRRMENADLATEKQ
ncbi:MAG: hypothetical protein U1E05_07825 [Patescibacteria group bacterium]|nr:hypothetical protein [Patescibacteria group bacterium]